MTPQLQHHLVDLAAQSDDLHPKVGQAVTAAGSDPPARQDGSPQTWRVTIIFLTSAIALAGFSPLGQALAQFMIVWQR